MPTSFKEVHVTSVFALLCHQLEWCQLESIYVRSKNSD